MKLNKFGGICFLLAVLFKIDKMTFAQKNLVETLIESAGFEAEALQVETQDGYLLTVHHVKPKYKAKSTRRPVLLMHGLGATSADFFLLGVDRALPYLLSNNGFDIYLGNARGNSHSLKHKTFNSNSSAFWNFSFHDIGLFDISAMIDFILNRTLSESLFYFGYSQGVTSLMVLLSLKPNYNEKIVQAHLMAPPVYFKHFQFSIIKLFQEIPKILRSERGTYDITADLEFNQIAQTFAKSFCQKNLPTFMFCELIFFSICGDNWRSSETDATILTNTFPILSSSISVKQIDHFFQIIKAGEFRQFDYKEENEQVYNLTKPPYYKIKNVKVPVYLYSGECDTLISEKDVDDLQKALPNVRARKTLKSFKHIDFLYGKSSRELIFDKAIKALLDEN